MQLLGLIKLDEFKREHPDARGPLDAWRTEAERAQWAGPQDVKRRYPSASFLADNKVIFNIKGNTYRLVIKAKYQNGVVLIEYEGTSHLRATASMRQDGGSSSTICSQ